MSKKPDPNEQPIGDAVEEFLRGLSTTHEGDQVGQGLDELAKMFHMYFEKLQESGFHYSKAFILARDWHGMWWQAKLQHEMMHMHPQTDDEQT